MSAAARPGLQAAADPAGGALPRRNPWLRLQPTKRRELASLSARGGSVRAALLPVGIVTLIVLVLPLLATHGARTVTGAGPFHPPSWSYPFGTDDIGRDVFSRVLYGIRESWLSALGVITVGAAFGALIGALAGAFGGLVDMVLMRVTDLFLALPAPVIAIAVVASIGPSLIHTLIALSVVWWPWYARIVRGRGAGPRLAAACRRRAPGRGRTTAAGAAPPATGRGRPRDRDDVARRRKPDPRPRRPLLHRPRRAAAVTRAGRDERAGPRIPARLRVGADRARGRRRAACAVANLLGDRANRRLDQRTT